MKISAWQLIMDLGTSPNKQLHFRNEPQKTWPVTTNICKRLYRKTSPKSLIISWLGDAVNRLPVQPSRRRRQEHRCRADGGYQRVFIFRTVFMCIDHLFTKYEATGLILGSVCQSPVNFHGLITGTFSISIRSTGITNRPLILWAHHWLSFSSPML